MTNQELEDRIFLLEDAVHQAIHTIEFLHGCLTDPIFQYAYPEQTLNHLEQLRELAPPPELCVHSFHKEGCASCESHQKHFQRKAEIEQRKGPH